jgi:hypothetical protein
MLTKMSADMQGNIPFDGRNGRSADKYKAPLKEKFVSLYEDIFAGRSPIHTTKDQGVQGRAALTRFWDELLLLKVKRLSCTHSVFHLLLYFKS